jgi:DNA end-binding protein Ku
MAARPLWKGQLRLSLVAMAVELHSATRTGGRIRFRQIHGPSGKPIRYEKVVPGIGPVDRDEIMKGYEIDKDSYVLLEPDEIDMLKLESRKTFELVQFVGACEIAPLYFDKPYYLVPADELAEDAYRVIREALRASQKVGLGQITLRGREYIAAVRPCGDGLLLETLHYEDEDRPPGTDNVIDLMAALKKSLQNTTDREGNSRRKKPAKKKAHSTATSKKRKRA